MAKHTHSSKNSNSQTVVDPDNQDKKEIGETILSTIDFFRDELKNFPDMIADTLQKEVLQQYLNRVKPASQVEKSERAKQFNRYVKYQNPEDFVVPYSELQNDFKYIFGEGKINTQAGPGVINTMFNVDANQHSLDTDPKLVKNAERGVSRFWDAWLKIKEGAKRELEIAEAKEANQPALPEKSEPVLPVNSTHATTAEVPKNPLPAKLGSQEPTSNYVDVQEPVPEPAIAKATDSKAALPGEIDGTVASNISDQPKKKSNSINDFIVKNDEVALARFSNAGKEKDGDKDDLPSLRYFAEKAGVDTSKLDESMLYSTRKVDADKIAKAFAGTDVEAQKKAVENAIDNSRMFLPLSKDVIAGLQKDLDDVRAGTKVGEAAGATAKFYADLDKAGLSSKSLRDTLQNHEVKFIRPKKVSRMEDALEQIAKELDGQGVSDDSKSEVAAIAMSTVVPGISRKTDELAKR